MTVAPDPWAVGEAYEPYVGRWSRLVAAELLAWLAVPPGLRWIDVGCGTGALTGAIASLARPAGVVGVDPALPFLSFGRRALDHPAVRFVAGDAQALPLASACADVVVSGLALNFVPRPERAVAEMGRVARPGGRVALYVWDYAGRMALMRRFWDAAAALDPAAAELDEGRRFPLCEPAALQGLLRDAGLREVEARAIEIPTRFRDFDDYWGPFLGGQGPAPGYAMSLDEERRAALRERIRSALPVAPDGSIDLLARAWAVRGVRD